MTKIIERGMIFNGEMVRAILDGRKTQTRRVMKPQPDEDGLAKVINGPWVDTSERIYRCPFGVPGDRIWVRETWAEAGASAPDLKLYRANYPAHVPTHYENVPPAEDVRWTPSIHMPRWASRILLEITDVRVEQLKSISEEEARSEGVAQLREGFWKHYQPGWAQHQLSARGSFATLWESIYGFGEWDRNPWVWIIEFKRIEGDGHATD
ncbi:hypothetical protein M7982_23720 [Enterobacter hormaechei subsp. xiangfangensis]|uniref:hypothetical protein n=1 Tax=Enterobacter hormaechei TaxID=158836 RepID=UPI002236B487|nr:hypothetical protein [Enterobacter hormaechei]MCW4687935.1 hypothetical protein [Enterobacter hormaechei subsp. xiangfangensis]MCW4789556.1 hypothetical protein [Enterobacter hormaechei subsp. xiangfangensis]MCW4817909.1 hypothetical protein [Enterobacter hormaechei subsp. xiangfangensis]MCW4939265.1 hypothetical protein [Enterobacter hormaechei subsp. xiangfangensis]MCW5036702.1 hypothetical protein [Enterobacter hormaechei subsp. xiangfangensis]